MRCEFCNKKFSSKFALDRHQKTSKKCSNFRLTNQIDMQEFKCNCGKGFGRKDNFARHQRSCVIINKVEIIYPFTK